MKNETNVDFKNPGFSTFYFKEGCKIYFKGYLYLDGEFYFSARDFSVLFENFRYDLSFFKSECVSGCFLIIVQRNGVWSVITDIIRSIPVFICRNGNGNFAIVDDIRSLSDRVLDDKQVFNFFSFNSSLGNSNCYQKIYSCQAAEIVTIEDDSLHSERYFRYLSKDSKSRTIGVHSFVKEFNRVLGSAIERMINSKPEVRNWIVPLSGGHDSRNIVNSLLKAGQKNVICYSYGTPGNTQSSISKKVAEAAGYEWYFIEYTENKWFELHRKGLIDDYVNYSFQGVSTPHLQDLLAVFELKEQGIANKNDVFIPGHSGITEIGFTQETEVFSTNSEAIRFISEKVQGSYFYKKSAAQYDYKSLMDPIIKESISQNINLKPKNMFAFFNWQERQTKFIGNSIRIYDYFDFDHSLPLWDRELVEFWLDLSPEDRLNRNLFIRSEREGVLLKELASIPFDDDLKTKSNEKISIRNIKKYIPELLLLLILRITGKKSVPAEGMNQIYAQKGDTLEEVLSPIDDFPDDMIQAIKPFLKRYPYQINPHVLSSLYAIRLAYDQTKL